MLVCGKGKVLRILMAINLIAGFKRVGVKGGGYTDIFLLSATPENSLIVAFDANTLKKKAKLIAFYQV